LEPGHPAEAHASSTEDGQGRALDAGPALAQQGPEGACLDVRGQPHGHVEVVTRCELADDLEDDAVGTVELVGRVHDEDAAPTRADAPRRHLGECPAEHVRRAETRLGRAGRPGHVDGHLFPRVGVVLPVVLVLPVVMVLLVVVISTRPGARRARGRSAR
jgi:hypothetical protein